LAKTSRDKGWRRQMPQCFEKTALTALVLFVEFSECNVVRLDGGTHAQPVPPSNRSTLTGIWRRETRLA
jgi:hypothetical protein